MVEEKRHLYLLTKSIKLVRIDWNDNHQGEAHVGGGSKTKALNQQKVSAERHFVMLEWKKHSCSSAAVCDWIRACAPSPVGQ
jgi:hypothetical protein